jgi:hypothetical protein
MSLQSLLNTTVNIEINTQVKSVAGLPGRTWTVTQTAVPTRRHVVDEEDKVEYARLGYDATDIFYFTTDPGIYGHESKTRLVWNGYAYYVKIAENQGGTFNRVYAITCEKKPLQYSTSG